MKKVLVVDDELDLVASLKDALELEGYSVIAAHDGATAVELVTREKPDLVLLDLSLPAMDGYQVLNRIRAQEWTRDLPVLIITARTQIKDLSLTVDCGANSYYVKPVQVETLITLVRTLLDQRKGPSAGGSS